MLAGVPAIIAPVFLVIAVGYLAIRTRYVEAEAMRGLGAFVLRIALPALIFNALTGAPPGETLNRGYLLAYGGASLAVFAAGFLVARRSGQPVPASAVQGLGMAGANSGFMGYPIAVMVIGPPAATILAQNMVVENLVLLPLAMIIAEMGQEQHASLRGIVLGIATSLARNPLLIAIAAGVAVAASGAELPGPVARPITLLASVAAPIALFVVGGTLAELSSGGSAGDITRVVLGKLVLHPLAVFGALFLVPGLDPVLLAGGTLFAAAPMMSIFPLIGARFGVAGLSAAALLAATVLSCATLTVLILVLEWTGMVRLAS